MALTDNRTQLQDSNSNAEVSGDSDASPNSNTTEAGLVIEGGTACQFQVTNAQEHILYDLDLAGTAIGPLDLSSTTVYIMIKDNLADTFANLGGLICLNDGTDGAGGDDIGYAVAGVDVGGLPYAKKYACYKLDVSVIVASPGTDAVDFFTYNGVEANLDQTAIEQVGYGSIHLAKGQGTIPNAWFDGIYYIGNTSYAATVTGGSLAVPETMTDLVGDDETVGAGIFSNPLGSAYYIFAPTEWGDAGTASSGFAGTDEQWYLLGDNGGGHAVGAGNFIFRLIGNATGTNSFVLTRVVIVNTGTAAVFDMSNTDMDTIQFDGCVFTDLGTITLQIQDAGNKFFINCVFNNCAKILVSSIDLDDCSFNGTTDSDGAILIDEDADTTAGTMTNLVFTSDGTGHAVHIRPTGAGPFSFDLDNWIYSGYANDAGTAANREIFINPVTASANITLNVQNGGTSPSTDQTGYTGTLTINNAVTVRVEGLSEGAACVCVANETIGTLTTGDVIFELLADSNGVAELTTFNYEAAFGVGLDVIIRTAQQGLPNAALQDDNGAFTDYTTEANSSIVGDMILFPVTSVVNEDSFQFGHPEQFTRLKLELTTLGVGGFGVTWEYWNGTIWTALSGVVDGTSALTASGENIVSWTLPGDWAARTDGGLGPYFYVRVRYTSGTMSTNPTGRKCQLDVIRYLTSQIDRTVISTGLTTTAFHVVDDNAKFDSSD